MAAPDVVDDGLIESVTSHPDRGGIDNAAKRQHGHLGGAAANIYHQGTGGLGHRQRGTNSHSHGFLDQEHFARASSDGRLTNRTALHLIGTPRHTDHDSGAGEETIFLDLTDKIFEHYLGDSEVSNNAFFERPDRLDVAGRAP